VNGCNHCGEILICKFCDPASDDFKQRFMNLKGSRGSAWSSYFSISSVTVMA
jgi:hypothetical protein